jgi:cytochrome c biogenesis protein CcmG, thiol:disulfide interchange protein DsbE
MRLSSIVLGFGLFALSLSLVTPSSGTPAGGLEGWEALGVTAKPFEVKSLAGDALSSADLQGKIVVIDLWATWCTPCVKEMPELAALHERWRSRKDVVLLSFNVSEEKDVILAFLRQRKITFPVYLGDPFLDSYQVDIFPTKLIFDFRTRPGRLRFRGEGAIEIQSIERRVAELLSKN